MVQLTRYSSFAEMKAATKPKKLSKKKALALEAGLKRLYATAQKFQLNS